MTQEPGNSAEGQGGDNPSPETERPTPQEPATLEQPKNVQQPAPASPKKAAAKKKPPSATDAEKPERLSLAISPNSILYQTVKDYRQTLGAPLNNLKLQRLLLEFMKAEDQSLADLFKKSAGK